MAARSPGTLSTHLLPSSTRSEDTWMRGRRTNAGAGADTSAGWPGGLNGLLRLEGEPWSERLRVEYGDRGEELFSVYAEARTRARGRHPGRQWKDFI